MHLPRKKRLGVERTIIRGKFGTSREIGYAVLIVRSRHTNLRGIVRRVGTARQRAHITLRDRFNDFMAVGTKTAAYFQRLL